MVLNSLILLMIIIGTISLAYFYASKQTSILVLVLTILCWSMSLLIIFLLPLDIYIVLTFNH